MPSPSVPPVPSVPPEPEPRPERLRPCPFCGATKHDVVDFAAAVARHQYPAGYRVECGRCAAKGPFDEDPVEALKLWDRRPECLPVSVAAIAELAAQARERAKRCEAHGYRCRANGDHAMAERWFDRYFTYDRHARQLRRFAGEADPDPEAAKRVAPFKLWDSPPESEPAP